MPRPERITKIMLSSLIFLTMMADAGVNSGQNVQPAAANYDETKVGIVDLPEILRLENGKKDTSPQLWRSKRRGEILRLFETNIYGRSPRLTRPLVWKLTSQDIDALGGLATRKQVSISLTGEETGPRLNLLIYVPNQRSAKKSPVFLGMNFNGNQSVSPDTGIALSQSWLAETKENGVVNHRATENSRGVEAKRWPLEMILKRGYAVATFS